jgi:pimeloyl-ACP methyl ester carboxylesterase
MPRSCDDLQRGEKPRAVLPPSRCRVARCCCCTASMRHQAPSRCRRFSTEMDLIAAAALRAGPAGIRTLGAAPIAPTPRSFLPSAIDAMIGAIGEGPVDVVALSTTSEFAARAALMRPEAIAHLVLVSPTGLGRRRDGPSAAGPRVYRVFRTPGVGSTLYRLLRTRPSIRFFLDMAFTGRAPEAMVDYAFRTTRMPGASYAPFYFLSGQMFAPDAVGDLYLPLVQPPRSCTTRTRTSASITSTKSSRRDPTGRLRAFPIRAACPTSRSRSRPSRPSRTSSAAIPEALRPLRSTTRIPFGVTLP